ncbi:hypothetical protein U9M48_027152 [Paspalum notatum var. saurae]|uniref:Uncharacterized protein n=1 Tax=Paspalum notatum var. saurae TaxID=547442 RepID=A0AAQ3WZ71_PASNO
MASTTKTARLLVLLQIALFLFSAVIMMSSSFCHGARDGGQAGGSRLQRRRPSPSSRLRPPRPSPSCLRPFIPMPWEWSALHWQGATTEWWRGSTSPAMITDDGWWLPPSTAFYGYKDYIVGGNSCVRLQ